jgi:hypothetical protein
LEAGLVDNVALGGESQPDGRLVGVFRAQGGVGGGVVEEVAFLCVESLLVGRLFDVCEESFRGFEGLMLLSWGLTNASSISFFLGV